MSKSVIQPYLSEDFRPGVVNANDRPGKAEKNKPPHSYFIFSLSWLWRVMQFVSMHHDDKPFKKGLIEGIRTFLNKEEPMFSKDESYMLGLEAARELMDPFEVENMRVGEAILKKSYQINRVVRLNESLIESIIADLEEGYTQLDTAERNGFCEKTFYLWLEKGKAGKNRRCEELFNRVKEIKKKRKDRYLCL